MIDRDPQSSFKRTVSFKCVKIVRKDGVWTGLSPPTTVPSVHKVAITKDTVHPFVLLKRR